MDGALDLAAVGALAAAARGIVGAAQFHQIAGIVVHGLAAGDEIGVPQAHFRAGRQTVVLFGRLLAEVVALDPQLTREGHGAAAVGGIFGMPGHLELFHLVFGVVFDDHLHGVQHGHGARGVGVEVFADAEFQHRVIHHGVGAGDADAAAELAQGLRRHAAAAQAAQGGHARVVPALDVAFLYQLDELALGQHRVGEVEARELDLLGMVHFQGVQHPVIELAVVLELQRADGVGDAFQRVRQAVGEVVHGIDAPLVARAVMFGMADAVQGGVAHDQIGRGHVDLGAQHMLAVGEFPGAHAAEQVQVLFHAAVAAGAFLAGAGQGAAVLADLVGAQVVHIGLALEDELLGVFVKLVEIVGGVEFTVPPFAAQPLHVLADGIHIFGVFLDGVGVVEAQVAHAAELARHAEVQADRLGMPQMQVAVGFRRKARVHLTPETTRRVVVHDAGADEVHTGFGIVVAFRGSGHGLGLVFAHGVVPP